MYLRKIILGMCLDVEHILKTRMLYDLSRNEKEDGYNIVKKYFWAYPNTKIEILQKADSYNFTSDLAEKHSLDEEYSVWNLVELLSLENLWSYIPYIIKSIIYQTTVTIYNLLNF